jgi:hypothetical protein
MSENGTDPKTKFSNLTNFIESAKESLYEIDNEIKENNISPEFGHAMKKFHNANLFFLCLKWTSLPYAVASTAYNIVDFAKMATTRFNYNEFTNSTLDVLSFTWDNGSILTPYIALLATSLYVTSLYSKGIEKMRNEHENLEPFKNELLDLMKIDKNSQIKDELTSDKLHKIYLISSYMQGSSTRETVGNIITTIRSLKQLWTSDGLTIFNNWGKKIRDTFNNNKMKTSYATMRDLNNLKEDNNIEYFKRFKNDPNSINSQKKSRKKIDEFNKNAINNAAKTYANQNLQLIFARVVQDILKEGGAELKPIHKNFLIKFEDLHRATSLKDPFDDNKVKSPTEIERISKMANDLLKGKSHLTNKFRLIDIVKSINPNLVIDDKIKYGSFEKHMKVAREKIAANKNEDHFNLSLNYENETLINPADLEKIMKINMEKAERKMKSTKTLGNNKVVK